MLSLSCKNRQGPKTNVSEAMRMSKLLQEVLPDRAQLQPITRKDSAIGSSS